LGRIEMHLISLEDQQVTISGQDFCFTEGECIHTENSYKYSPDEFINLADAGGFKNKKISGSLRRMYSPQKLMCLQLTGLKRLG
jgi:uncharacterized SAM-dependent methyltransferase